MHVLRSLTVAALLLGSFSLIAADSPPDSSGRLKVLLVTGGHPFETNSFYDLFKTNTDISCQIAEHPHVEPFFDPTNKYDVIVLYDYNQKISDEGKTNFLAQLKTGTGLVVLHHAIVAFPKWDEFYNIVGAHYYLAKTNINGVEKPRSGATHGLHFTIHVLDPQHPVTRGITDYEIHDEAYKWFDTFPDIHPLLATDEPQSGKVIGWAKTYGPARVVFMESGHDHFAYENPNFQKILRQAIRWTAKKD